MSKPQLEKAIITVLDGADKNKIITVLFNPTEYTFSKRNTWAEGDSAGRRRPVPQEVSPEEGQAERPGDVEHQVGNALADGAGPVEAEHVLPGQRGDPVHELDLMQRQLCVMSG